MTAEAVAVCLRGCLSKQEEAEKWYRGLSVANRCRLWDRLHGKGALEPIKECVFALALSAFEDLVAREGEPIKAMPPPPPFDIIVTLDSIKQVLIDEFIERQAQLGFEVPIILDPLMWRGILVVAEPALDMARARALVLRAEGRKPLLLLDEDARPVLDRLRRAALEDE